MLSLFSAFLSWLQWLSSLLALLPDALIGFVENIFWVSMTAAVISAVIETAMVMIAIYKVTFKK